MCDDSLWSDYDQEYDPSDFEDIHYTKCKYCGYTKLVWTQVNGKWKLFTQTGKLHVCKPQMYPAKYNSKIETL